MWLSFGALTALAQQRQLTGVVTDYLGNNRVTFDEITGKNGEQDFKITTAATYDIKVEQKEFTSGIQVVNDNKTGVTGDYDFKLYASTKDLVKFTITNKTDKFIGYKVFYNGSPINSNDGAFLDIITTAEIRTTIP